MGCDIDHDRDRARLDRAERMIIASMRRKVSSLKDAAVNRADDKAKQSLSAICQFVVDATDADNRLLMSKAAVLGLRPCTLSTAAKTLNKKGLPVLRTQRACRRDALDYRFITMELWHIVCEEKKGKSKKCFRTVPRVDQLSGVEKHRVRFLSGTVSDAYKAALLSQLYISWKSARDEAGLPSRITERRFRAGKCKCVRRADRKYCICAKHDEFREFLNTLMLSQKCWHEDADTGECSCHESVVLTSTSMGDATNLLTCGRNRQIVISSELGDFGEILTIDYKCASGACATCKNKFPSCRILRDNDSASKWRVYEYVIKLRKGEKMGRNGLLTNGKRPRRSKELVMKNGTRLQFMNAFRRCWITYKSHSYETYFDAAVTQALPLLLRKSQMILWADFSAFAQLRFARELTCQQGNRCSLWTCVSIHGVGYNESKRPNECHTISHLAWNDNVLQDAAVVNDYMTLQFERMQESHLSVIERIDTIWFVSDKCAGQFRSKEVARALSHWLSTDGKRWGIKRIIKVFKQTGHSGSPADGEGGRDKRIVTDFILDTKEETWRAKLEGKWPISYPKPLVTNASTATMIARLVRGTTTYEKSKRSDSRKTMQNNVWTVNERYHYDTGNMDTDHRDKRFAAGPIPRLNSYFCWMLEASHPKRIYLRTRACVCTECMDGKFEECKLLYLGEGGPGPFETVNMNWIERRGVAVDMKRRSEVCI